jgi:hypothetical protein
MLSPLCGATLVAVHGKIGITRAQATRFLKSALAKIANAIMAVLVAAVTGDVERLSGRRPQPLRNVLAVTMS